MLKSFSTKRSTKRIGKCSKENVEVCFLDSGGRCALAPNVARPRLTAEYTVRASARRSPNFDCATASQYFSTVKVRIFSGRCAKCLRFAPSFRTTRGGARCCTICLRFATAHRTTTVIQHRPSVNPSGFTAERRRITAARYMKYMFSFWGYRHSF